jgi:hypothetical protein
VTFTQRKGEVEESGHRTSLARGLKKDPAFFFILLLKQTVKENAVFVSKAALRYSFATNIRVS